MSSERRGRLFVVSAPSGAGKTTVVRRLVESLDGIGMSRSYTSRPIRAGERDGVDYNFITATQFGAMREAGGFLEWAEVFGNLYGTGKADTERRLGAGEDLVLVIDVQGARKVRASGLPLAGIFLLPPSFAVLEARLRERSLDPEEEIRRRLVTAREEVGAAAEYDYVVVNDNIEACAARLRAIVVAERAKSASMKDEAEAIARTFAENGR